MRDQNTGRGPKRNGERRGGRYGDRRRKGSRDERPRRFRKGSGDLNRRPYRDSERRRGDRDSGDRSGDKVRRRISRDQNGRKRVSRGNKREESNKPRDLDSELMNYWVKSGKNQDQDGKNLAQQKLNEDLDNYWKQKTEKVEEKPKQ